MKFKVVIAIAGFLLLASEEISAQVYSFPEYANLFSRVQAGGSARIRAMGGVQNSLGGDVSSAYYNPAGLGMFNRSDFSLTLGYSITSASANYINTNTNDSGSKLIVPNFGIAFNSKKDGSKLLSGTFAINFNRINDFNNSFTYTGRNDSTSIIDYFMQQADGRDSTQFQSGTNTRPEGVNYNTLTGLAFNNYLIGPLNELDFNAPKDLYYSRVPLQSIVQKETVKTTGAQNQWSFSYGVNLSDRIFIGGGLGLSTINYKTTATYSENYSLNPLQSMSLTESLELSATGINATLGIIGRPIDQVQLGFSLATPTSYAISETYTAVMSSKWNNYQYFPGFFLNNVKENLDILTNDYTLITPWRFSGGATFFIQKKGLISADVEYLSYGSSKYSNLGTSDLENQDIKTLYQSVLNIRVGGEYRLNNYRFRGGFNLMPDPYKTAQNDVDRTLTSYTAGIGYRRPSFYVDMAFVLQQGNTTHTPYTTQSPIPASYNVTLKNQTTSVMFTVGFPF